MIGAAAVQQELGSLVKEMEDTKWDCQGRTITKVLLSVPICSEEAALRCIDELEARSAKSSHVYRMNDAEIEVTWAHTIEVSKTRAGLDPNAGVKGGGQGAGTRFRPPS
jgi:hypothetical protein